MVIQPWKVTVGRGATAALDHCMLELMDPAGLQEELEETPLATGMAKLLGVMVIVGATQRVVQPEVQHFWVLGQSESLEHPAIQMDAIPSAVAGQDPGLETPEATVGILLKAPGNCIPLPIEPGMEEPPVE
ncbi:hypothetical protein RvY_13099 [Ramazzottius varieornatus]|uniref:Uncharacterized protein n=1 Tax=Ramazzottius varieornatus TaxID=947166 RepID=A0A1D1VLR0_RAMVA|nr:hypothetical protein RvY_13099 [Ramazzottius varieornatus]